MDDAVQRRSASATEAAAASGTAAAEQRGSKKLSALFEPPTAAAAQCVRCRQSVYATERTVASNGSLFHKACFSCKQCATSLTLYTHRTSPNGGGGEYDSDAEIYCSTHEPAYVPRGVGVDSRGILSALEATRLHDRWKKIQTIRCPHIGVEASFIRHALDSQALSNHVDKPDLSHHMYPPVLLEQRDKLLEQLRQAQAELELEQRQEEERLLVKFREQRQKVAQQVQQEADRDWEAKLHDIAKRLESLSTKAKREDYDSERARLESDAKHQVSEKRDQNMKLRTLRIVQQQQEETSQLVHRQSERMLEVVSETKKKLLEQQPSGGGGGDGGDGADRPLSGPDVLQPAAAAAAAALSSGGASVNGGSPLPTAARAKLAGAPQPTAATAASALSPPPARPPRTTKAQLYRGQTAEHMFRELDDYVINVASADQTTFTDLVSDLTDDLMTDLAKVRAIYRWVTVKDLNTLRFHDFQQDSPMGLLRGIKYGTETYHTLFKRLCSYVGLHAVEVKGKAKSVGYEPGMKFEGDAFRNTWNAVLVDGDWRLVQCNWGARHIVLNKDKAERVAYQQKSQISNAVEANDDNIRYQYDDHYFLTDPKQFIMEFFPNDVKWQLLEEPISLQQFEEQPFVRSIFFKLNLVLLEPVKAVVVADETGYAQIRLGLPPDAVENNDLVFHYQLRHASKEHSSETALNGVKLDRFAFQTLRGNEVVFKIHVPMKGEFFFEIFANKFKLQPLGADDRGTVSTMPFRLKCACKFRIVCDKLLSPALNPLPNCAAGEWGPAKAQRQFQLQPITHPEAVVNVDNQLELKMTTKGAFYFHVKLRANGMDDRFLEQLVHLQTTDNELIIRVVFPEAGQYGLDMYARSRTSESAGTNNQPLAHACKYLLNVNRVQRRIILGAAKLEALLPTRGKEFRWGAQPACTQLGVSVLTHPEARMRCLVDETIQMEFRIASPTVVLSAHLAYLPDGDDERDMLGLSRATEDSNTVRLTATCRRPGDYLLSLIGFERVARDGPAASQCLFNYLLLCSDKSQLAKHILR